MNRTYNVLQTLYSYYKYSSARDMLGETRIKRQTASFARIFFYYYYYFIFSPSRFSEHLCRLSSPCGRAPRPRAGRPYRTVEEAQSGQRSGDGPRCSAVEARTAALCLLLGRALPRRVVVQRCSLWGFEHGAKSQRQKSKHPPESSSRSVKCFPFIRSHRQQLFL